MTSGLAAGGRLDVLYIEGPGDIVAAFESWRAGKEHATETSVTFSSQVFEHCKSHRLSLVAISYCSRKAAVREGTSWRIANVPRRMIRLPKVGYHLSLFWYWIRIASLSLKLRPRFMFITSGVVAWSGAKALRHLGFSVVPILHNALWPEGFPERRRGGGIGLWRMARTPSTLVVSDAIRRQLASICPAAGERAIEFRPTFSASQFHPPIAADHAERPFRVLFVGRVEEEKGVFDLLEIAARLESSEPGRYRIDVCGTGSQFGALSEAVKRRRLDAVVTLWGRLERVLLVERYAAAHVVIVPTRSSFAEGFAQVVPEAVLTLRPVVTSAVVPASEPYRSAVVLAVTDSVDSYVAALSGLAADRNAYEQLVEACRMLRPQIFDDRLSFKHALRTVMDQSNQAVTRGT